MINPLVGRLIDRWGARIVVGTALSLALAGFVILWMAGTHLMGLILGVIILDLGMHTAYLSNQVRVYSQVRGAKPKSLTVIEIAKNLLNHKAD